MSGDTWLADIPFIINVYVWTKYGKPRLHENRETVLITKTLHC